MEHRATIRARSWHRHGDGVFPHEAVTRNSLRRTHRHTGVASVGHGHPEKFSHEKNAAPGHPHALRLMRSESNKVGHLLRPLRLLAS